MFCGLAQQEVIATFSDIELAVRQLKFQAHQT